MPIYTVSQISEAIKKTLEGSFSTLQIRGEISNLRLQSSGHYYFTLKDDASQISCALFRGDASRLKSPPKDGDQIIASGNLSVFTPKGSYQLIVKSFEPYGLGDLLVKLEALKRKYQQMGYFEAARKRPLPRFAKVIGVITSPTGAVIQDIIQTLSRRHKGFHLILCPTKVQGEGASEEIAEAIRFMNAHNICDIIIVGRGGGSLEDLWAFNQEIVVEAIYKSKIPVVAAIGHETDFTLADFVADLRAPTPTAAAEMALPDIYDYMNQIRARYEAISKLSARKILFEKKLLNQIKNRSELTSSSSLLQGYYFNLDRLQTRLEQLFKMGFHKNRSNLDLKKSMLASHNPQRQIDEKSFRLQQYKTKLGNLGRTTFSEKKHQLSQVVFKLAQSWKIQSNQHKASVEMLKQVLESLNPESVLDKGYALIFNEDQSKLYTRLSEIQDQTRLKIHLKDGSCIVDVKTKQLNLEALEYGK